MNGAAGVSVLGAAFWYSMPTTRQNNLTALKDDVCIWMIIIQCCNEYLLTLSYICYAVYSTIKIRRQTRGVDHYREKRRCIGLRQD